MRAIRLKTEHLTAPMGVDFTAPQLFWNCEGGVRQTAWQILAADDGGNLLWDSGKTEGAAMRAKWGGSPVLAKTSVALACPALGRERRLRRVVGVQL